MMLSLLHPKYCSFCRKWISAFIPIGDSYELFHNMHVIGAGERKAGCPYCISSDRERWQLYVIRHYTNILTDKVSVLHFAPEHNLSKRIKQNANCSYCSADIAAENVDYTIDMTNIPFPDETFDYIIANHVLEHITDEKAAINELIRCIKPAGNIILSFPICMDMDTFETEDAITDEDRIKYYGQRDHCRLYGKDYLQRLSSYGLDICVYSPEKILKKRKIERNAYIRDDVALLCRKRIQPSSGKPAV